MMTAASRITALVRDGLSRLRLKLLDLTNRNRLLNFRFSETSRKFIRVVDELPDALYARLTEEETGTRRLYFAALPEPPRPEKDPEPHLLEVGVASTFTENALPPVGDRSSRRFHPSRDAGSRVNAAEWARENEIDPSFDLPMPQAGQAHGKHTDNQIQTLLFPESMEAKLATIREDANIAQQELGVSTLFAAFGYLEWYESNDSEEPLYSPLFLLPVQMDRELKQHRYRYFIECGEGADPSSNVSLRERLKRDFQLELPELREDETPDTYMGRVKRAVRAQERWKIRRFVVIGHFSFSRLVMYEDLASDRWADAPLEANTLISTLLAGAKDGAGDGGAIEFDVDEEKVERHVPVLISDTDSSQFSAIVDAMQGRSFALKGPPGTGKSQTITNLIAAALALNKRVLFVAEKQAALEIVSKRLCDAGLRPYLLELHSTKVQKKKVLQAFEERLKVRKQRADNRLETTLQALRGTRASLKWYASLMNCEVGRSGLTLHDIYWQEQQARRPLTNDDLRAANALVDEAFAEITAHQIAERGALLDRLAKSYQGCAAVKGEIDAHPLFGIQIPGMNSSSQEEQLLQLRAWSEALARLERVAERSADLFGFVLPAVPRALVSFCEAVTSLPVVSNEVDCSVLSNIRDHKDVHVLAELVRRTGQLVEDRGKLSGVFGDLDAALPRAVDLQPRAQRLSTSLRTCGIADGSLNRIPAALGKREVQLQKIEAAAAVVESFAVSTGLLGPLNAAFLNELVDLARLIKETPADVLRSRSLELFSADVRPVLVRAVEESRALKAQSEGVLKEASLTFREDPAELRAACRALQETPWPLRVFSGRYRAACRLYKRLSKLAWRGAEAAAGSLESFTDLIERRTAFEKHEGIKALSGAEFAGLDTPFASLIGVVDFWQKVRKRWPSLDASRAPIQKVVLTAQKQLLDDLSASVEESDLALLGEFAREMPGTSALTVSVHLAAKREILDSARGDATALLELPYRYAVESAQVATVFDRLESLRQLEKALRASRLAEALPAIGPPGEADVTRLEWTLETATKILSVKLPTELTVALLSQKAIVVMSSIKRFADLLAQGIRNSEERRDPLVATRGLDLELWFRGTPDDVSLVKQRQRISEALAVTEEDANEWAICRDLTRQSQESGVGRVSEALWRKQVRPEALTSLFHFVYLRGLIRSVTRAHPKLPTWNGEHVESLRQRLVELDTEYLALSRKTLAAQLSGWEVPVGVSQGAAGDRTERSLIEHEIGKQRRHIPIRDLMRRASVAAQALKPCFMMSPASAAQFLPASESFDLVIIDEASQMRPEEALGAIARGKQSIIVGDPMQLPPTTFFDAVHDEGDVIDDEEIDIDTESILDMALSSLRPSRELKWHYRSKHHSLIAFSNREFYNDNLIVFPSPRESADELGVKWVPVSNGAYQASLNVPEAELVLESVADLMRRHPKSSIGVVAINRPQKDLLTERFDKLFADDPALEDYRCEWAGTLEPFFVKNLENVQGDERDIIVISTVYGPSAPGAAVHQRFGPINSRMGHRRLNVLFTRAKERVVVVTSLRSEDVRPQSSSSRGVMALKNYLEYARSGRLDAGAATGGSPESPFEVEVAQTLTQLGYQAEPQVGVAGYFVDLAVRHPINRDHFVIGIECDGASYHSAKSARDRDRLRQMVLERLGWKLYRIWSTDWFRAREREVRRLSEHLKAVCS